MMVSALYAGYPQDAFATVNEVQAVMQSNPVKGQVVDENGDPVIGATVMMKGTSKRTSICKSGIKRRCQAAG